MPRVSVILNSYNQAPYLAEAIESVRAQTFSDFELILIDNGSTDDSQQIARDYAARDGRIRLSLHDENRSLSSRQNEGVHLAVGELVSFLYSDDRYLPRKLERQVAMLDQLGPEFGVVYAPALGFNMLTGARWQHSCFDRSGAIFPALLARYETHHPDMLSPMTRRSLLLRFPFHDDLFAEGEAIYLRLAMVTRFHYDPEPVVELREHDRNIGKAIRRNHENFLAGLERLAIHPDFPDGERASLRDLRARIMRDAGWATLRMGSDDVGWARARLAAAVRERWRQLLHPRVVMGIGLSLLPRRLRRIANRVGFLARRPTANPIYISEYK